MVKGCKTYIIFTESTGTTQLFPTVSNWFPVKLVKQKVFCQHLPNWLFSCTLLHNWAAQDMSDRVPLFPTRSSPTRMSPPTVSDCFQLCRLQPACHPPTVSDCFQRCPCPTRSHPDCFRLFPTLSLSNQHVTPRLFPTVSNFLPVQSACHPRLFPTVSDFVPVRPACHPRLFPTLSLSNPHATPDCFRLFPTLSLSNPHVTPDCFRLFPTVSNCFQLCPNPTRISPPDCFRMFPTVYCLRLFPIVSSFVHIQPLCQPRRLLFPTGFRLFPTCTSPTHSYVQLVLSFWLTAFKCHHHPSGQVERVKFLNVLLLSL